MKIGTNNNSASALTSPRTDLFISAPFVACLALLMLNDWVLKEAWHNTITGKLSDFSGVALFSLFWIALIPSHVRTIFIATAAIFAFWKSPLSQPLIELWNAGMPLKLARTVDYGDLVALLVLPGIASYVQKAPSRLTGRWFKIPFAACALAAMMGTSKIPDTPESRALHRVWDERVSRYTWNSSQLAEKDERRLITLLRTIPEKTALAPTTVYRTEHRGDHVINVTHKLPEYGISTWYYPNPGRTGEFVFDPHHLHCDRALAEGTPASDPFIRAKIDFRATPAEPWVTRIELDLCDLPLKRTYDEALRYFFDIVLPPIETALIPH